MSHYKGDDGDHDNDAIIYTNNKENSRIYINS
jgi:hypothetical protein